MVKCTLMHEICCGLTSFRYSIKKLSRDAWPSESNRNNRKYPGVVPLGQEAGTASLAL